jgi:hypothetical protein
MPAVRRLLLLLFAAALGMPGVATAELPPPIPHGRALAALASHEIVLVGATSGFVSAQVITSAGGELVSGPLGIWQVPGSVAAGLVPALERLGVLRYAEPSRLRAVLGHVGSGDPLVGEAWHLERVGAAGIEPPAAGIPITIVDTGLDVAHPDFAGRPGIELLNAQDPSTFGEELYHGTVVASTAGAAANGVGTVGVHPLSALRIFDLSNLGDAAIIAALDDAVRRGDSVVSLSIGGPGYSRALYEAVMRAVDKGALVVAAAGNHFLADNPDIYPADYPHVLTVGATDVADEPVYFSSASPALDLAAPGADIPVQDPLDPAKWSLVDGTSFSAPIVSAAAAWVWSARAELDWTQMFEIMRASARDVDAPGFDQRTGFGVVDIAAALAWPEPVADPLEPNDDVDLVVAGGVFSVPKPALTGPGRGSATLEARLDAIEDPHDVYRVFVPAGKRLAIVVTPTGKVDAALWSQTAKSVLKGKKQRLALAGKPGQAAERIVFRNASGRGVTLFLDLWIPRGRGGDSAGYELSVSTS